MIRINIKPLSVNEAWKGKRFRTDKYKAYQKIVVYLLTKIKIKYIDKYICLVIFATG